MKKLISGFVAGALVFGALGVYAAGGNMIEIFYSVKDLKINQVSKLPTDDNLKPFTYKGRTFVPLAFVADNLGQVTTWDAATSTVSIDKDTSKDQPILDVIMESYEMLNNEDISAYINTFHSDTQEAFDVETLQQFFDNYDFNYEYEDVRVIEVTNSIAIVRGTEVFTQISGADDLDNIKTDLIHVLQKDSGKWKILTNTFGFGEEIIVE